MKYKVWCKDRKQWEEHTVCIRTDGQMFHLDKGRIMPLRPSSHVVVLYTGIHDDTEDEIEICDGDIVEFVYKDKTYIGEVKFEAGAFILACNDLPDSYITMLDIIECDRDYWWIDGKVLGNVFENPELLETEA